MTVALIQKYAQNNNGLVNEHFGKNLSEQKSCCLNDVMLQINKSGWRTEEG
jgi:hypothetical protein